MNKIPDVEIIKFSELNALDIARLGNAIVVLHYTSPIAILEPVKNWAEAQKALDKLNAPDCDSDAQDDCSDAQ